MTATNALHKLSATEKRPLSETNSGDESDKALSKHAKGLTRLGMSPFAGIPDIV